MGRDEVRIIQLNIFVLVLKANYVCSSDQHSDPDNEGY